VLAFFFGTRCSELLAIRTEDIADSTLEGGREAITVSFLNTKTRQTLLSHHDPFVVHGGHPVLMEAFKAFDDKVEWIPGGAVFRDLETGESLTRVWFDEVVKRAAPDATPHSCRVGIATELWAAGEKIEKIMAVGRWTSQAALLYVIGAAEDQISALDRVGGGNLMMERGTLHKGLGTSNIRPTYEADFRLWAQGCSRAEA